MRAQPRRWWILAALLLLGLTSSCTAPSGAPSSRPTSSGPPSSGAPSSGPTAKPPDGAARGSLPIGSANYPVPSSALYVSPSGNDAAAGTSTTPKRTLGGALAAASPGQTIVLRGGVYHESDVVRDVLSGITIENYPGEAVWFDGSVPVTNWTQNGSTWVSTGWTAQFDHSASFTKGSDAGGFVLPQYPMAAWPDMVFVDGVQLTQVASPSAVVPGTFAVDYAHQTLTIGSDPSGHQLRASDLAKALTVAATNVTVRGIGFRRFANSLPTGGAIYFARSGDVVENCVLEDMATQGVSMYKSNLDVNHVTVTRTGMLGITGYHADYSTVENVLVTQSNDEHFNKAPSSAGMKIVTSTGFTIRNSTFANGYDTHGIWTDISCNHFTIVGNDLYGNGHSTEMQIEESGWGIVANNNVFDGTNGIYVYDSNDIKVYNNTMGRNSSGSVYISQDGRYGSAYWATNPNPIPSVPWQVQNIDVYNNEFQYNGGPYGFQVWAFDGTTHIPASAMHITIQGNLFHARCGSYDSMVAWGGSDGRVTRYDSLNTLYSGIGVNWTNTQSSNADVSGLVGSAQANAAPLPSDVAAAMGVPSGTKMIGSATDQ
jgi:parallel beta-helix repeat protein